MSEIVIGVDGSASSVEALRWAAREADVRAANLVAVMAWGEEDFEDEHLDLGVAEATSTSELRHLVVGALGEDPARSVALEVPRGDVVDHLVERARSSDLMVVGARGLGGFRGLLLGSVSRACVRRSSCPVAVIHAPTTPRRDAAKRIVVGVDGSHDGDVALAWAVDEARLRGARLDVVHAWHAPYVGGAPLMIPLDPGPFEDSARALLVSVIDRVDVRDLPHPPEQFLVPGSASAALLNIAEGADLVVVGTHGHRGMSSVVLGSVSSQVVHHATSPVVVVPVPVTDDGPG